jgi:hypothetical protein
LAGTGHHLVVYGRDAERLAGIARETGAVAIRADLASLGPRDADRDGARVRLRNRLAGTGAARTLRLIVDPDLDGVTGTATGPAIRGQKRRFVGRRRPHLRP